MLMGVIIPKKERPFVRAWAMVLLAFALAIITQGFGIYHFSMIRGSVVELLGATTGEVGLAYSCYALSMAFTGLFVGGLIERIGLGWSLRISAVVYSLGFVLIAYVQSLPMLFGCYILLGFGNAFAGILVITGIPANWFVRQRGIANGIIWASTFVGSLFVTNFIALVAENSGWQTSMVYLGFISFAVITFVSFFLKWRPQDVGLLPDGVTEEEAKADAERAGSAKIVGLTRAEALKTPTFWIMAVAIFLIGVGEMGPFQNLASYVVSLGNPLTVAASFMSLIGLVSFFSKIGCGFIIDKLGPHTAFAIVEILATVGLVMLAFSDPETNMAYMYVAVSLFGVGESASIVCFSASTGKFLGAKHYAQIFGAMFVFRALGDAVGSPLIGAISESALGWAGAFGISAAFAFAAALVFFFAKKDAHLASLEEEAAKELDGNVRSAR